MKLKFIVITLILISGPTILFATGKKDIKMMKEKIAQFVPVELKYDTTLLDEREKVVVQKLFLASKVMDEIFGTQVYSKNEQIKKDLESSKSEYDKLALEYFNIMAGPFDRLDHDKPFFGGNNKPLGANFYPADMTKDEFNKWIDKHPGDKEAFTSELTVIRRDKNGLKAIPYSEFYKDKLTIAANLLNEAADYSDNSSLKKYLVLCAKAFLTNNYFESDMAWMDLKDSKIEFVIGPYEVYEDNLFNYKASFESFLTIRDPVESDKLEKFGSYLAEIEDHLPLDKQYKNTKKRIRLTYHCCK